LTLWLCITYYVFVVYDLIMLKGDSHVILDNWYKIYVLWCILMCNLVYLMVQMLVAFIMLLIKCIVFDILTFIWNLLLITLYFVYLLDLWGFRFSGYAYVQVVGEAPLWLGHEKWCLCVCVGGWVSRLKVYTRTNIFILQFYLPSHILKK
jgi:hypothetical protein